ncbi:hypothetical protein INT43_006927 [Umbelopsis isabellina]|uniref:Uncharacterized protein n=1 Tax=Mortierella isabellina TaxID=91625 RepID=A0A8H7UDU0_MORIS|nr:hypothetical protein INT43_006927 [Umbelopsis isabellina]
MTTYANTHMLPPPVGTNHYTVIPTKFTDSVSAQEFRFNLPEEFDGLERIIMQTSGNLQRLMSAYFNGPVQVEHVKNIALPETPALRPTQPDTVIYDLDAPTVLKRFDRQINMYCAKKYLYQADSVLIVHDQVVLDMLEKEKAGIGQIFWKLQQLPDFKLHSIGRHGEKAGGSFWRDYSLSVKGAIYCYIRETFPANLFTSSNITQEESGHREMGPCPTGTIWVAE